LKGYFLVSDARADLDGIWEYVAARASVQTASKLVERLEETFVAIAQSPSAGVLVPGFGADTVRKFPVGNYLISYRIVRFESFDLASQFGE